MKDKFLAKNMQYSKFKMNMRQLQQNGFEDWCWEEFEGQPFTIMRDCNDFKVREQNRRFYYVKFDIKDNPNYIVELGLFDEYVV